MVENRITSYKNLSNGSPLRMLPHHKKATSTVSINCSKVNDSFFAITNIFNFFYLMPTTYQIQSCSNVTPNNIQNDFLYDFPDDFHYDFSDDFSSMVPLWFLHGSSMVPPMFLQSVGQGKKHGAIGYFSSLLFMAEIQRKRGYAWQQIKKVRKAVYTCLSTAFGALSNKKRAGQQFSWQTFLVRRSETSPDVTVRL